MNTKAMVREHLERERSLAKWARDMGERLEKFPAYGMLMAVLSNANLHPCRSLQGKTPKNVDWGYRRQGR